MFGHGRPSSLAFALARIALALCAVLANSAWGQVSTPVSAPTNESSNAVQFAAASEPVRLRISWGGGEAHAWSGEVRLDSGSLSNLKSLGTNPDAAGSVWVEGGRLRIGTLGPHKSDRVEIVAESVPNAQLVIELAADPKAVPVKAQVALDELARRPMQLRLDDQGNTLEITLIPTPILQISIKGDSQSRDSLIFAPGQQLSFEMALQLPNALHGTTLDLQTTLSPARRKDVLWTDIQKLPVPIEGRPTVDLNVPLQQPDGVYTVHVAVSRPSGYFRDKFFAAAATPLAERSFEVVVIDPRPATQTASGHWVPVLEIDPTNPRWIERLPTQFRRIPGLSNHGSLGSIRAGAVDSPLGRFIELPPTVAGADPHWQGYTLPLEAVGVPHMLEIDYPADAEQQFGLSIVEPNATGVVAGEYRDTGV